MFKLDKNGNLIVSNGFNSGTYQPRMTDRSSVYLGETTRQDIAVRDAVRKRRLSEAKVAWDNEQKRKMALRRKMRLQDYLNEKQRMIQKKAETLALKHQDRETHKAILSGRVLESNKFIGSPFAGFGNAEQESQVQRINPDSEEEIDIVEADIPPVEAYGIKTWMETSTSEYTMDKIEDTAQSYTPGREVMQTMVDYARKADQTLVNFPKSIYEMTDAERAQYAQIMEQTGESRNAFRKEIDPKLVKYGLYALAAYLLLK